MPRDQRWFEMRDLRGRTFDNAAWIPLRSTKTIESEAKRFAEGHEEESVYVSSAAFSTGKRAEVEQYVDWSSLGLAHDHGPYVQDGTYHGADQFLSSDESLQGTYFVFSQRGNATEEPEWHLHPDIPLGLNLKREGDVWLAMDEGYTPIIRLTRDDDGAPTLIEMRSSHLKDFLAARGEFLCLSTYTSREFIAPYRDMVSWSENPVEELDGHERWQGSVSEMTEDGHAFGSSMAVFHVGRKNFDLQQDVPAIDHKDDFETRTFTKVFDKGKKIFRIWGELWKVGYIEPGVHSTRVRGDDVPSLIYFYTDASGTKESAEELTRKGRWLWFRPDVINKGLEFRGATLEWYTADTGGISMGPGGRTVFGFNESGLINVYAKDIRYCHSWQQQIWAGFNVTPEGGVSRELLMAQAEGDPAETQAPEAFLADAISVLNSSTMDRFGFQVIKPHEDHSRLIRAAHRFRALDEHGLRALAKDLARIIIDSIDVAGLQKIVPPPKNEKRGSLKSLEAVVALTIGSERARSFMKPLFGVYELRLADAHLPSSEVEQAYSKVFVDRGKPFIFQGAGLLAVVVDVLHRLAELLRRIEAGLVETATTVG